MTDDIKGFPIGIVSALSDMGFGEIPVISGLFVRISLIKYGKKPEQQRHKVEIVSAATTPLWPEKVVPLKVWKWWNTNIGREIISAMVLSQDLKISADTDITFVINGLGEIKRGSRKELTKLT